MASGHNAMAQIGQALSAGNYTKKDPGNGGTIYDTADFFSVVEIRSAGTETRTVAVPASKGFGKFLYLRFIEDGGDVVLTFTSQTLNSTGNNTLTFDAAGEFILLQLAGTDAAPSWKAIDTSGTLSTV